MRCIFRILAVIVMAFSLFVIWLADKLGLPLYDMLVEPLIGPVMVAVVCLAGLLVLVGILIRRPNRHRRR